MRVSQLSKKFVSLSFQNKEVYVKQKWLKSVS